MKVFHWVPSNGNPTWSCVESWINLQLPEGANRIFKRTAPGNVRAVWNGLIKDFLATDAEWLFSTHMDVAFVPETLTRLLSWDKPLVSALVFMRHSPVVPQIWKNYDGVDNHYVMRVNDTRKWFYERKEYIRFGPFVMVPRPDEALVDAGFTATACTLIHRSVLEKMRDEVCGELWFEMDNEIAGGGEDRRFYEYAHKAGFTCYIDRSCIAGHVAGDICTSSADFIAWDSVSTFLGTGEPKEDA